MKKFNKREKEIKNTKIYNGSPFLKGYVQSFPNKERVSLKKIAKISLIQHDNLASRKSTLHPAANSVLHSTIVVKQCRTLLHNPNYKPYAKWVTNAQLQITKPMQFATKPLIIQVISKQQYFYTEQITNG